MDKSGTDKAILMAAFARIDPVALALALGSLCALVLFAMTAILLIKGSPPGIETGDHLSLLGIYLPGYAVNWPGACLGAVYGGILGAIGGFVLALFWNLTHYLYITAIVVRAAWWRMMAE